MWTNVATLLAAAAAGSPTVQPTNNSRTPQVNTPHSSAHGQTASSRTTFASGAVSSSRGGQGQSRG
eukprot:5430119-Pleurochrysis_carterae.AAC.1